MLGRIGLNRGKIFVNNGFLNKMVYKENIPDGFVKGNLYRMKKEKDHC